MKRHHTHLLRTPALGTLVVLGLALGGCALADFPQTPIRITHLVLNAGMPRTEVEAALGPPLRSWQPTGAVTYHLYNYKVARKPRPPAPCLGPLEGVVEDRTRLGEKLRRVPTARLWIAYDAEDRVLSVHTEMAELPNGPPADSTTNH